MKARDYHLWWKASRIGLGHPLESDNYAEIVENLSPAGVAVAIVVHMIPDQSSCDKDHMVSDLAADRAERWSAALREIGAERLAGFVTSSVGVDHIARVTAGISPEDEKEWSRRKLNPFEAFRLAGQNYYRQLDIETHAELESLADQYAGEHADELSADVRRHGDQRPTSASARRSFDDDWLEAVHEQHDKQREKQRLAGPERKVEEWERERQRAETLLESEGPADQSTRSPQPETGGRLSPLEQARRQGAARSRSASPVEQAVDRMVEAYRELAPRTDDQLGPAARAFRSRLAALIDRHRDRFPTDVRPDGAQIVEARVRSTVDGLFAADDAAWLSGLGRLDLARDERYDPVAFGVEGDVDDTQRTVEVGYTSLRELHWNWAVPCVRLLMGPVGAPAVVGTEIRSAVEDLVQRSDELGQSLAAALLLDFRERFLPVLSVGRLPIYRLDVTDDDVLRDVESASIMIQWNPVIRTSPRIAFYFGVVWDAEHGVCLAETPQGGFELTEL